VPVCGNNFVVVGEWCDVGNLVSGDGCSLDCVIELEPPVEFVCGDGDCNGNESFETCPEDCNESVCGNIICEYNETYTNCPEDCQAPAPNPICGNNITETGEECDDNNIINGDGCSENCTIEPFCGDGTCDDNETYTNCVTDCDAPDSGSNSNSNSAPRCYETSTRFCELGEKCIETSDCSEGLQCEKHDNYSYSVCKEDLCNNGVLDNTESDIDCGGDCKRCLIGQSCDLDSDCYGNLCNLETNICVSEINTEQQTDSESEIVEISSLYNSSEEDLTGIIDDIGSNKLTNIILIILSVIIAVIIIILITKHLPKLRQVKKQPAKIVTKSAIPKIDKYKRDDETIIIKEDIKSKQLPKLSPELIEYINKAKDYGLSDEIIKQNLLKAGWDLQELNKTLKEINSL
jgi:cysteine-rich repeat protein